MNDYVIHVLKMIVNPTIVKKLVTVEYPAIFSDFSEIHAQREESVASPQKLVAEATFCPTRLHFYEIVQKLESTRSVFNTLFMRLKVGCYKGEKWRKLKEQNLIEMCFRP